MSDWSPAPLSSSCKASPLKPLCPPELLSGDQSPASPVGMGSGQVHESVELDLASPAETSQPSIPGCLPLVYIRELPETLEPGGKNKAEKDPFFSWK